MIEITEAPNKYSPSALALTNPSKTKDEGDNPEDVSEVKLPKSDSRSSIGKFRSISSIWDDFA